jgi:hypothetical protein
MPFSAADIKEGQRYPLNNGDAALVIEISHDVTFPGWTFVQYQNRETLSFKTVTMSMFLSALKQT